jgi:hypothetical protein
MADFVIETTIERGVVNQERVSVDVTALPLAHLSLVCVDGPLERATRLQTLYVYNRDTQRSAGDDSHALSSFSFIQLNGNCFVDVPAAVLALTRLSVLHVGVSSVCSLCWRC